MSTAPSFSLCHSSFGPGSLLILGLCCFEQRCLMPLMGSAGTSRAVWGSLFWMLRYEDHYLHLSHLLQVLRFWYFLTSCVIDVAITVYSYIYPYGRLAACSFWLEVSQMTVSRWAPHSFFIDPKPDRWSFNFSFSLLFAGLFRPLFEL